VGSGLSREAGGGDEEERGKGEAGSGELYVDPSLPDLYITIFNLEYMYIISCYNHDMQWNKK
jgi:hypothetical protein